jgi:non-canonical (house-cleaning) NTP pyrophosphatase
MKIMKGVKADRGAVDLTARHRRRRDQLAPRCILMAFRPLWPSS